ncbi:MAG TPA: hypothetical protein ENJ02_01975, partial [Chloroflexi bacterium]|nr:hypothetical protein [Chloroflexota bacterium]
MCGVRGAGRDVPCTLYVVPKSLLPAPQSLLPNPCSPLTPSHHLPTSSPHHALPHPLSTPLSA